MMKKGKNWLSDLLEETSYKFYVEHHPKMVVGIRQLLVAGESKIKIKKFCDKVAGKSLTANMVGHLIDYVNKQAKN